MLFIEAVNAVILNNLYLYKEREHFMMITLFGNYIASQ
jgi:hypothetical protein